MIILIGYGFLNKFNIYDVYGVLFGKDEIVVICENLKWKYGEFEVSEVVKAYMDCFEKGIVVEVEWNVKWVIYKSKYVEDVVEFEFIMFGKLLFGWEKFFLTFTSEDKGVVTRIYF